MDKKILIIEDEVAIQKILSEPLTFAGYKVTTASDVVSDIICYKEITLSKTERKVTVSGVADNEIYASLDVLNELQESENCTDFILYCFYVCYRFFRP